MVRIMLGLSVLLFAGCMGGEEVNGGGTRNTIRPGFYEDRVQATYDGVFLDMVSQYRFNGDGTYSLGAFIGTLEVLQAKGRWSHGGSQLFFSQVLSRDLNEAGAWGPWVSRPDDIETVRNITETSYQYYFDYEKTIPPEDRALLEGIRSGWNTCNRLGD